MIGIGLNIKILKIPTKKILITGVAGFIGYHLAEKLLQHGITIIGLDNLNSYYNVELKWARLNQLGISRSRFSHHQKLIEYSSHNRNLWFYKIDLEDDSTLDKLFTLHKFDAVCNLAAQAGVRYSIENPKIYIESNVKSVFNKHFCHHILFSGPIPPNPTHLLANGNFGVLLKEARNHYDFIVVDLAPTLLVTDTILVSKYADVTLCVVRSNVTDKKIIPFSVELSKRNQLKNMAYVINAVDRKKGIGYNYGYEYTYGK